MCLSLRYDQGNFKLQLYDIGCIYWNCVKFFILYIMNVELSLDHFYDVLEYISLGRSVYSDSSDDRTNGC